MNSQSNQIIVEVIKDNNLAILKNIPYELKDGFIINEENVRILINQKGIKSGVNWNAIKIAVSRVLKTQQPLTNLIIAKSTSFETKVFHFGYNKFFSNDTIKKLILIWTQFREILKNSFKCNRLLPVFFYLKDEVVFEFYYAKTIDVFGNELISKNAEILLSCNESIKKEELDEKVLYTAQSSGYLIIDDDGKLGIFNPLFINEENTQLSLYYYPLSGGEKSFAAYLKEICIKYNFQLSNDFNDYKEPTLNLVILKKGYAPIHGRNAKINWVFINEENQINNYKAEFNLQEIAPYKKIKANTVIAEKTNYFLGQNGLDIYGNAIPATIGNDILIRTDSNIVVNQVEDKITYCSSVEGMFFKINNSISIEKAFVLETDIDATTGNINYEGAVVIHGNVKSGFNISCRNKLHIKGSVENGCKVVCDGDILISYGVVGEDTIVQAKGYCEIGFVIDSKIISRDDLIIYNYAYNSKLFSRGIIEVKGRSINNKNSLKKSAVIGGIVNSLKKVVVHSIGSDQSITNVVLGKDLHAESQIADLKSVLPNLSIKLAELIKKISFFNIRENELTSQSIAPELKAFVKNSLSEIKKIKERIAQINALIIKFEQMLYLEDLKSVDLTVFFYLIPEVQIKIINHKFSIFQEINSDLLVALVEKKICLLNHDRSNKYPKNEN